MKTRDYDYAATRAGIRGMCLNVHIPFHPETFAVDHAGLARNTEHYVASGVKVLLLTYGSSEYYVMSESEILAVTETVTRAAAGKALVIACSGRWWRGQMIEFAHQCEKIGADALMVIWPETSSWLTLGDPAGVVEYHRQLNAATRIPIVYHSWSDTSRTIDTADRVCDLEHVVGLKQEYDNYPLLFEMGIRMGKKTALISGGGGIQAYWSSQFGYSGWLTGIGQWAPRLEVKGSNAMLAGDIAAARAHIDRITPFRRLAGSIGNHMAIKYAMDVAGLAGGSLRPPQTVLTQQQKDALKARIVEDRLLEYETRI